MTDATEVTISRVIDAARFSAFQKRTVALCGLIAFVEGFDATSAGYVGSAVAKAWSLDKGDMGLFFSLGLLGLMIGALALAPFADRLGRKPVLLGSLILFGLASLGMALSPWIELLYITRFITGLGIGGAMPNAIALTSEYVPARVRSLAIVLMSNGFAIGSIAAGLTAARIVEALGWNSVFAIGGVLPLLLAPVAALLLPESPRFLASKPGQEAKVAALMRRMDPTQPESGVRYRLDDVVGARMSVMALFRDGRARRTVLLWIVVFCSLLELFVMTNWLPTEIAGLGVSVGVAILIATGLQVGGVAGALQGWMLDRVGPRRTLTLAYLIAAVSVAGIALAGANLLALTVCVLCAGFGIIGGQTAANAVTAQSYPTELRSTGVGWYLGVGRVGSIIGPALAGWFLAAGVSLRDVFLLAVIPALIAAGAASLLGRSLSPEADAGVAAEAAARRARLKLREAPVS